MNREEYNIEKLKLNLKKLLKLQLALESYEDENHSNDSLLKETNLMLKDFRKIKDTISTLEQIDQTNLIIDKYYEVINRVGRENFVFYEDGDISYIWKESHNCEKLMTDKKAEGIL